MARDDHRVAMAGGYGAAGTASMSGAISLAASAMTVQRAPGWALPAVTVLALLAVALIARAWRLWTLGLNPRPPRSAIQIEEVLSLMDKFFPHLQGFGRFETGFLEDARYGRQRVWGRLREPDMFESLAGDIKKYPRVFIPPEYWNTAGVDWLGGKTEPLKPSDPVYSDLCLGGTAVRWNLCKDWISKRYYD